MSLDLTGFTNLVTINARDAGLSGSVDIHGLVNVSTLDLDVNGMTSIDASGCVSITTVVVTSCASLQTLNCNNCTSLTDIDASGTPLISINVLGCSSLTSLSVVNTQLSSINCTNLSNLIGLAANDCPNLDSVLISGCSSLSTPYIHNCILPTLGAGGIDDILANLVALGVLAGDGRLDGTGNQPPTSVAPGSDWDTLTTVRGWALPVN